MIPVIMGDEGVKLKRLAYMLLTLAIILSYSNSFQAGWHFDDVDHITRNKAIQIKEFTRDSLIEAIYAAPRQDEDSPKRIFRPLASLTFALNWYLGKNDVFGYHLFNILLHAVSACLLFEVILISYATPKMPRAVDGKTAIAFSSAMLWALNPIQTQAVTYIVQRGTSMAAMFLILGILLYMRGRLSGSRWRQAGYFAGVAVAYALALASKENAIVLPAILLLVEAVFFLRKDSYKPFVKIIVSLCIILAFLGVWWIVGTTSSIGHILDGYAIRPYNLLERLMTQPRVILLYLSLILYPMPDRLSIQHDITHSISLLNPMTTLASISAVALLIAYALYCMNKNPILSFSVLFFFIGHVVESSILPLELVFEHRNYLPSMFVFWPVSVLVVKAMYFSRHKTAIMANGICYFLIALVVGFGIATYQRNYAWADELTLWQDAVEKSVKFDRPYINLAQVYDSKGEFETALDLYAQAMEKYSERRFDYHFVILNNTAGIFYKMGNYSKAAEIWSYTANHVKDNGMVRKNLAMAHAQIGEWEHAIREMNAAIKFSPKIVDLYVSKAQYLLRAKLYGEAVETLEMAIVHGHDKHAARAMEAIAFYHMKEYGESDRLFRDYYKKSNTLEALVWLLAINLSLDDSTNINQYTNSIYELASEADMKQWISIIERPDYHLYGDRRLIEELGMILQRKIQEKKLS
jgi:protein O-mannosyl-transferase